MSHLTCMELLAVFKNSLFIFPFQSLLLLFFVSHLLQFVFYSRLPECLAAPFLGEDFLGNIVQPFLFNSVFYRISQAFRQPEKKQHACFACCLFSHKRLESKFQFGVCACTFFFADIACCTNGELHIACFVGVA